MSFGTDNEENIFKSMQISLDQLREETDLVQSPTELGICGQIEKQHLRTSTDGLSTAKTDGDIDEQGLAFEIKSLATINSRRSSEHNFIGTEKLTRCTFGDSVFKKLMDNDHKGHRVQVLHHAMVLKLNCMLCLVAIKKICNFVLVCFPEEKCDTYKDILDNCRNKHLEFLHNTKLPFPEISPDNIAPSSSYTVEVETVKMNFALWKACGDLAKAKGLPLPGATHIIP